MLDDNQGNGCSEEAVIFGTRKREGRAWVWPSKRISVRRELGDCTRWNELNGTWWKIKEKKTCGHDFTLPKKKEHGGERTLDDFPGEATPWLSKGQCCLEEEKEWAVRDHFQRCLQFRLCLNIPRCSYKIQNLYNFTIFCLFWWCVLLHTSSKITKEGSFWNPCL